MLSVVRAREKTPDEEEVLGPTDGRKECDVCGQVFDLNDLDQIFHHDDKPHKPLTVTRTAS